MGNLFDLNNPFWSFINKIFDVMILGIIWFVCCLPIVTIGASTTALYYTFMKLVLDEDTYVIKQFFNSFKQNFKQATIIWIIYLIVGIILVGDILVMNVIPIVELKIFQYFFWVLFIIYLVMLTYIFPLLARFENTTKALIKLSFMMPIKHLPWTVLMFLIIAFLNMASKFFLPLLFVLPVVIMFIYSYIFIHIFSKYNKQ